MSGTVDNSEIVANFIPEEDDGDTFLYTELLDRSKRTRGDNRMRVLRAFFHRSRSAFWAQWSVIKTLCDQTGVRAYTRLAPRSFAKVGKHFTQRVLEQALAGNFDGMRYLYASSCGLVVPERKIWLWDVDLPCYGVENFEEALAAAGHLLAKIPSRKGYHLITKPFDPRSVLAPPEVSLHKDNPTNLYIPKDLSV